MAFELALSLEQKHAPVVLCLVGFALVELKPIWGGAVKYVVVRQSESCVVSCLYSIH